MQIELEADRMAVKKDRVMCPTCGRLVNLSVRPDTTADHLPAWCRWCGWQGQVKIVSGVCYNVSPNR